jgi:hypothetical protein
MALTEGVDNSLDAYTLIRSKHRTFCCGDIPTAAIEFDG